MLITLSDVKQYILKLNTQIKDIQVKRKELREQIEIEKQNLSALSSLPISLEDHLRENDEFILEQREALKENIRNYLKGNRIRNEAPATQAVRSLDVYLRRFGMRRGGNEIHLPFVLAIGGDWKKLRDMVDAELKKLPSESWGPYQSGQKAKKTRLCRERIEELEKAIELLEPAGHEINR